MKLLLVKDTNNLFLGKKDEQTIVLLCPTSYMEFTLTKRIDFNPSDNRTNESEDDNK